MAITVYEAQSQTVNFTCSAGDLLVVGTVRLALSSDTYAIPAGWDQIVVDSYYDTQIHGGVASKVADGTETSVTLVNGRSNSDAQTPSFVIKFPAAEHNGFNGNVAERSSFGVTAAPSITTTIDNCTVYQVNGIQTTLSNITIPNTTVADVEAADSSKSICVSSFVQATAGATPETVWGNGTIRKGIMTFAVAPLAPTLSDVDGDEITTDGQSGATFTYSGFSSDPTSFVYSDGTNDTPDLLSSASGGSGTFDLQDVTSFTVDTAGIPFSSANYSIVAKASYLTEEATLAVTHNPKAGWTLKDMVGAVTGEGTIFPQGKVVPDTSQAIVQPGVDLLDDGTYTTDLTEFSGVYMEAGSGLWEPFTITTGASGSNNSIVEPIISSIARSVVRGITG